MLQIALLGGLSLAWDDQPLTPIASTRARALFAYLVLNRHQLHRRAVLAGLFWPDAPEPLADLYIHSVAVDTAGRVWFVAWVEGRAVLLTLEPEMVEGY